MATDGPGELTAEPESVLRRAVGMVQERYHLDAHRSSAAQLLLLAHPSGSLGSMLSMPTSPRATTRWATDWPWDSHRATADEAPYPRSSGWATIAGGRGHQRAIAEGLDWPLSEGLEAERREFVGLFSSEDGREGITAFLEKRVLGRPLTESEPLTQVSISA